MRYDPLSKYTYDTELGDFLICRMAGQPFGGAWTSWNGLPGASWISARISVTFCKGQSHPGLSAGVEPAGHDLPFYLALVRPHLEPNRGLPTTKEPLSYCMEPSSGPPCWSRLEHRVRRGCKSWAWSAWGKGRLEGGSPYCCLQLPDGRVWRDGASLVCTDTTRGSSTSYNMENFNWILGKILSVAGLYVYSLSWLFFCFCLCLTEPATGLEISLHLDTST